MADPHLVTFLAERDEPCPACTYNLRGLQTDRCPECSRELVLNVRLAEPRMGAWIASLVGVCTMLGFNGLLSLYFIIFVVQKRGGSRDWPVATALFVSTGIAAASLVFLLRRRRWFCNLPSAGRTAIAIAAWVLTALSTLVFFTFAR